MPEASCRIDAFLQELVRSPHQSAKTQQRRGTDEDLLQTAPFADFSMATSKAVCDPLQAHETRGY